MTIGELWRGRGSEVKQARRGLLTQGFAVCRVGCRKCGRLLRVAGPPPNRSLKGPLQRTLLSSEKMFWSEGRDD